MQDSSEQTILYHLQFLESKCINFLHAMYFLIFKRMGCFIKPNFFASIFPIKSRSWIVQLSQIKCQEITDGHTSLEKAHQDTFTEGSERGSESGTGGNGPAGDHVRR